MKPPCMSGNRKSLTNPPAMLRNARSADEPATPVVTLPPSVYSDAATGKNAVM